MNTQTAHNYLILLCSLVLLKGCGSFTNSLKKVAGDYIPFYEFTGTTISDITIRSDPDSNNNLPTAVDILFIVDSNVAKTLTTLSGPDWFSQKKALLLKYQQTMTMSSLEIVPQSAEMRVILPEYFYQAVSVLVFANYVAADGQYPADITQYSEVRITLKNQGYVVEELNP